VRYPDQGLAIEALCNLEDIGSVVERLTQGVADIYLADVVAISSAGSAPATPARVPLSAEQLASKAGLYREASSEELLQISVRDGKLMGSAGAGHDVSWELIPVNANRFVISGTTIALDFVPATAGRGQEMHVIGERPNPDVFQRVNEVALSSRELRPFEGEYISATRGHVHARSA